MKVLAVLVLGAVVAATGCSGSNRTTLVVSAASSLTDAFREIGSAFHEAHPGVAVTFNFASSSSLAAQIVEGAPVDVFASANADQMRVVTDAGRAAAPAAFATNRLVVVRPTGSAVVETFADLAAPGVAVVLASPEVPAGAYARDTFERAAASAGFGPDFAARVEANVRSREANVRAVLAKVELGEADAGVVYATDAAVAGDAVDVVEIPAGLQVPVRYPIATLTETSHPTEAEAFVAFVLGPDGQAILQRHGFGAP